MGSATTAVAVQYRLKEWAEQIRECQNRPAGMNESKLLLQTAPHKGSVSGSPCSRGSDAADCPGKHLSTTAGNTKRQRYTAGAFRLCKRLFRPRNRIHTHAAACGSP